MSSNNIPTHLIPSALVTIAAPLSIYWALGPGAFFILAGGLTLSLGLLALYNSLKALTLRTKKTSDAKSASESALLYAGLSFAFTVSALLIAWLAVSSSPYP